MNTELQSLETEIKRTQLLREQLALADQIRKRERRAGAVDVARNVVRATDAMSGNAARVAGSAVDATLPVVARVFNSLLWFFVRAVAALGIWLAWRVFARSFGLGEGIQGRGDVKTSAWQLWLVLTTWIVTGFPTVMLVMESVWYLYRTDAYWHTQRRPYVYFTVLTTVAVAVLVATVQAIVWFCLGRT